jgi:hypothetical protein
MSALLYNGRLFLQEILSQDLFMIERESELIELGGLYHFDCGGVIAGLRRAGSAAGEDGGDGMETRVAPRSGIGVHLAQLRDVEGGLLFRLPRYGLLKALPVIDESAGKRPAERGVAALDDDNAFLRLDERVDGEEG